MRDVTDSDPFETRTVRLAYDTVAEDCAARLPDTRAESPLDLAMVDALADRGCQVEGVDLSPGMVAMARRDHPDLSFAVGSLLELPCADEVFDGVEKEDQAFVPAPRDAVRGG